MYTYSEPSKGAFSTRPCQNTSHISHEFKQHANSNRHQRLQKKLTTTSVYVQIIIGIEKINLDKKRHVNQLYIRKCSHTIYYVISKNMVLSWNYSTT